MNQSQIAPPRLDLEPQQVIPGQSESADGCYLSFLGSDQMDNQP